MSTGHGGGEVSGPFASFPSPPPIVSPSPVLARVVGGAIVSAWTQALAENADQYFVPLPPHLKYPMRRMEQAGESGQGQGVMDPQKMIDAIDGWKGAPMGHRGGPHQGMK